MPALAVWKRQGALSGVTQGAEDAGTSGYNSIKSATSSLSTGQIVGAIVAIVIGFVLICLMLWYLCIRRTRSRRGGPGSNFSNNDEREMTSTSSNNVSRSRTAAVPYGSYDFSKIGRGNKAGMEGSDDRLHLTSHAA